MHRTFKSAITSSAASWIIDLLCIHVIDLEGKEVVAAVMVVVVKEVVLVVVGEGRVTVAANSHPS